MIYTMEQSKDPEMYELWSEYTVKGKKTPMLCAIIHSDCLSSGLTNIIEHAGEAIVAFEVIK